MDATAIAARPTELLLLVWVLSFFVIFSLATLKREPYLMTLVPGIGLMIGYFYDRAFSGGAIGAMPRLLRVLLALLAVTYIVGMFFGRGAASAPMARVIRHGVARFCRNNLIALAGSLLYAVVRSRLRLALGLVGALAVGYAILLVNYVFPAIDQGFSPRKIHEKIKTLAGETTPALFHVFSWVA